MQLVKHLKECSDLSDVLTDYVAGSQLLDDISEAFEDIAMSAVAATDTCPYLTSADIKDMASVKLDIIYGGKDK
jgi:hypothetical protein